MDDYEFWVAIAERQPDGSRRVVCSMFTNDPDEAFQILASGGGNRAERYSSEALDTLPSTPAAAE